MAVHCRRRTLTVLVQFSCPLTEKPATRRVLPDFVDKAVDCLRPIRFNAARCPDSSVGRAGD
ncbi:MAG TPA: hypothetical protein DHV72_01315 [Serratia grimesii]|uniref:Uncharacterized protein n=1 Tax=Serratia grimesii TaxID=82995 RepID=A0A9C7QRQ6_9GAMM|nr:hypothetical protein [Serratia grimesii]